MEILQGRKEIGQVARSYGIHPITIGKWQKDFMEHGPEVFGGSDEVANYEKKVRDLERLIGQKEVEIALLKNFLAEN